MGQGVEAPSAPAYEDIVAVVCQELQKVNAAGVALDENTDLTTELNVDSVAVMDLLFELEEHYDVSVPLNLLGDVRTVGQLAKVVRDVAGNT